MERPQTATAASLPYRSQEDAVRFYEDQRREFLARCEPFVKVMVEIRMMQPMRYFIAEGRHIEPEILWMPGSKETYDLCQQMIDHIKQQYLPGGETT